MADKEVKKRPLASAFFAPLGEDGKPDWKNKYPLCALWLRENKFGKIEMGGKTEQGYLEIVEDFGYSYNKATRPEDGEEAPELPEEK